MLLGSENHAGHACCVCCTCVLECKVAIVRYYPEDRKIMRDPERSLRREEYPCLSVEYEHRGRPRGIVTILAASPRKGIHRSPADQLAKFRCAHSDSSFMYVPKFVHPSVLLFSLIEEDSFRAQRCFSSILIRLPWICIAYQHTRRPDASCAKFLFGESASAIL